MLTQQARSAGSVADARQVEVIVTRLHEGRQAYTFGLLLGQVQTLLRRSALSLRTNAPPGSRSPVAEALYDEAWMPVYDLAQCLGVLAPWKMGVHTTVRDYLLVVRGSPPLALAVDEVAEIGFCPLDQILALPAWLRRQLRPPLVWGGVDRGALAFARTTLDESATPDVGRAPGDPALILLLDCFALQRERK